MDNLSRHRDARAVLCAGKVGVLSTLLVENPFTRGQEPAIVQHMNDDHSETMRGCCRRLSGLLVGEDDDVAMAGIDAEGFDLLVGEQLVRLAFPETVATPAEARERLVALAR